MSKLVRWLDQQVPVRRCWNVGVVLLVLATAAPWFVPYEVRGAVDVVALYLIFRSGRRSAP